MTKHTKKKRRAQSAIGNRQSAMSRLERYAVRPSDKMPSKRRRKAARKGRGKGMEAKE